MTEQSELQARIAALSGKINLHKQQQPEQHQQQQHPAPRYRGSARWSPFGRGGRTSYPTAHKNRTLVLNGTSTPPSITASPQPTGTLVSARGTNKQLMTKDTYEREQRNKMEYQEQRRVTKRQKRNVEDQHKILRHFDAAPGQARREMVIDGIRFNLAHDGSKLVREPDAATANRETPKRTKVAGVEFYRTKHGNLVRASALNATARTQIKQAPQCEHFTRHGTCPFGPRCRFAHDPSKVAICKDFLKTGSCPRGDNCDMSHEMSYHRVPACTFFLRGNCTNDACRYPHVHVSPAAPVCRPFATLGYCVKGADCDKRHVNECPDYANHGFCANSENGRCSLPHPERASALRKAAERQAKMDSLLESDLSSDEDNNNNTDVEDVDSDEEGILMTGEDEDSHALAQQQDFVGFT